MKKQNKLKRYSWKTTLCIWLMLSVAIIHFLVFWGYVNFETIRLSFFEYNGKFSEYEFVGLKNYSTVLSRIFIEKRPTEVNTFWNTFRALSINFAILPICVITAYAFYKKVYGEKIFRVIFYLPSIITIVIQCSAFLAMFKSYQNDTTFGPYAAFFRLFGIAPNWLSTAEDSTTLWGLIYAFCIIAGLSTNVILMSSAMLRIPSSITEALELDGCGYYKEMFKVTIPLIMPTITTWITAIFTAVFSFMMQPMLLTETANGGGPNGKYYTIPWQIFDITNNGASDDAIPEAAALCLILSIIIIPIVALARKICNIFTEDVTF